MRDKRTPKDVCGKPSASPFAQKKKDVKTIRIPHVRKRIPSKKEGKNFRCKKYPDTCERTGPNCIVVNCIVLILDRDCMGREENIE